MPFDLAPRVNSTALAAVAATLLALVAPVTAAAQPTLGSPEHDRFLALADEAAARGDGPLALAPLIQMSAVQDWLPSSEVERVYSDLADRLDDADARALAGYRVLRAVHASGDLVRATELEREQGFLTRWAFIGPFPNDGMAGLAEAYPPETAGVDGGTHPGKVIDVSWRETERVSETGYFDLRDVVRPTHAAVAYVAVDVTSDRSRDARLSLAVDGAYRVWVDGEPVAEQPDHLGGFLLRDTIPVRLRRGTNQILVKIGTVDAPMGLHARLLDDDGEPLVLEHSPARRPSVVSRPSAEWSRPASVADRFGHLEDGDAFAAAAFVVRELAPDSPAEPWLPLLEQALAADPGPEGLLRSALVVTAGWRAVELLDRVVELSPDPMHRLAWVGAVWRQLGASREVEAAHALRAVLDGSRPPLGARLLWTEMLEAEYFYHAAFVERLALAEEAGWPLPVLTALERSARDVSRDDLRLRAVERLLELEPLAFGWLDDFSQILRTVGRGDEVGPLLDRVQRRLPLSPAVRERVAAVHRAVGDTDAADLALGEAIALCPGSARLREARGRLRLEAGDRDGARADLADALEREPQDSELREYLAAISPEEDRFWEPYRLSLDALLALRRPPSEEVDFEYTYLADQRFVRVFPNGLATAYVQQAFDVYTRSGADALRQFYVGYSPDSEVVEVVAVRILKPDGTVQEVYDTRDYSADAGPASIYYDVRSRVVYLSSLEPGDVLSYEYTVSDVSYRNIFDDYFGDFWFVQASQPKSLARYGLLLPEGREVHVNEPTPSFGDWSEELETGQRRLIYEARDVPHVPRESGAPGPSESFAYVSASTYASWDALAEWYWHLIEDQLVASPEIRETVRSLVEGVDDERDRIAAIYGYVVRNTRYVGLEFGIHGYKPYRTSDCFNRRFGDCKDTASLMKVMLDLAGIPSHVVLVRTRDMGTIDGRPPSLALFNHAITYVPGHDLYLDGTAGFSGSNELPSGDQGATAVIVLDGAGGRFVTIPNLDAETSITASRVDIDLGGDLATGTATMTFSGGFAPTMRRDFEAEQRRVERFQNQLARNVPGITITDATFSDATDIESPVVVEFSFEGGDWARWQGDTLVVHPLGSPSNLTSRLAGASTRTTPLVLDYPFGVDEHYRIGLPEGVGPPDGVPEPVEIEGPFGSLSLTCALSDGVLETRLDLRIDVARVEVEDYAAFRAFVTEAETAMDRVVRFGGGES